MKLKFLLYLSLPLLLFSCKKDSPMAVDAEPINNVEVENIEDLNVPDGFDYSVSTPVDFDLTMVDSTGAQTSGVLVDIIGLSEGEDNGKIYTGLSNAAGQVQTQLQIPNHFTGLLIRTTKGGNIRNHSFEIEEFISAEIAIDEENFSGNSADERGLNCYPELTGIFSSDNKLVGIASSEPITNLELVYSDGTSEIIENTLGQIAFTTFTEEICNDGIDNDGDGLIDCADPQCGNDVENCNGSIPCISTFYQIVGKKLKQLNPTTGEYTVAGNLPDEFDVYNGSGYNNEDGYIYCTGKINSTGKIYLVRMYSNANVANLGELGGFEGRSYTGDMDDNGNWVNFYHKNGTWNMASVDVSEETPTFVSTPGIAVNDIGNVAHHDWVYNAVCDKFYTMAASGAEILVADHKASPPTVASLTTYSGLNGGAYGAAWSDASGALYFSNNGTGNIYKVDMDQNCNPTGINIVISGSSTSNNDGMSCPYSPAIQFGAEDSDGDGITDGAELASGTNPANGCDPNAGSPTCYDGIHYSFVGFGSTNKEISYINVVNNCDAPEFLNRIYNNNVNNDIDNDGVPNASDPDPLNPNKMFTQYAPSNNEYGTYAFEDLWPEKGDYDFNDFVVQVRENIVTNSANQIFEVTYELRIMAMGGSFNNNFGITLQDPNNTATTHVYSPANSTHEVYQRDGKEVFILKHPKALFYTNDIVNAELDGAYYEPVELQVKVELDGTLIYPADYKATFFIEQHGVDGHEIHLPNVTPTNNMNTGLFGTIHDDTAPGSGKYFLSPDNLPWGLYVPTEWEYPLEGEEIIDAYLDFDDYAQSNPSLPWYNGSNRNVNKIYTRH